MRYQLVTRHCLTALLILLILMASLAVAGDATAQDNDKVSRLGEYKGYSKPLYTGWKHTSQYITVRDGTRLAIDLFRPAYNGRAVDTPLPVIWTHHRYQRSVSIAPGQIITLLDGIPEFQTLLSYGYVIAVVDSRGSGASFGTRSGEFSPQETMDAYDITEWLAAQSWSSGNIGMVGGSYLGITQYLAASTKPPHLKAIFPMVALFDLYDTVYPGGVFGENFIHEWANLVRELDTNVFPVPVDDDPDGVLARAAVGEHKGNVYIYETARLSPFRDSVDPQSGVSLYTEWNPATYLDAINESGVAVYTLGGWHDIFTRDSILWYVNLTVPQKLLMTPWYHMERRGFDLGIEHVRWFDYWLKGIDNGIMTEPPITYYVMGTQGESHWRTATTWPLPNQHLTAYYLATGSTDTINSTNDGLLTLEMPTISGTDSYIIDYTTTSGKTTRWANAYGGQYGYLDRASGDRKALTYTSEALAADTEITGHPVAHLWITSTAPDADVFVYLEEVNERGISVYISEGVLRASHRTLTSAPYQKFGLPYHRSFAEDTLLLYPNQPVELVFDLLPTSNVFDAGNRIRITITGADVDNFATPTLMPSPVLSIIRDKAHQSHILLPIIPIKETR